MEINKSIYEKNSDVYFCKEFDIPEGDLRDVVLNHMRTQANIKWVCSKDFILRNKFSHWSISLDYKEGETYYGIIYSDYKVSYQQFVDLLEKGTYTTDATDWKTVPGVGCYSSILNSIQQFEPTDGFTDTFMPGSAIFKLDTVGGYKLPELIRRTQDINEANGPDGMYEAYTHLKKGDIIFFKDYYMKGNSIHVRLVVEEPIVVRKADGTIDAEKSTVKTIEQTNQFDVTRTDIHTTWYIDHLYTFATLYETNYLPLTLKSYSKKREELEKPYILLDKEVEKQCLEEGRFGECAVKSNFPIRFVDVTIVDEVGNVVAFKEKGDLHEHYDIPLKESFADIFSELEKGDYIMKIKAGISRGSADLAEIKFSFNQ